MLGILSLWFIFYLFGRIQGRSVGELDEWQQEFLGPQPDATIFVYNQTDKELDLGHSLGGEMYKF
ncbi:uncharacterized protein [Drosophila kikkawai]|uniref:Uncharacterized protein n=1 Tax=Drosophila kikkawai TaxID=30033 RepID=A0A6P4JCC3_DROKI|nr:uncharacterized protein LOC108082362 [Drosophila kikkawai]